MYTKPMVLPLTADGKIYALLDERGNQIASGSREVCRTLLYLLSAPLMENPARQARGGVNSVARRERTRAPRS
jgi:hypothetical protein